MSKPGKTPDGGKVDKLPFEEALQKLEAIVETMESGELALETLLARYEEGMNLAQACQARLADAERKIQQLEKAAGSALKLKPMAFDASEE